MEEAWCMVKLKRLFPDWYIPAPKEVQGIDLQNTVYAVAGLSSDGDLLQRISPLEEELKKLGLARELTDLLVYMLVLDPRKRPSVREVLGSRVMDEFEGKKALEDTEAAKILLSKPPGQFKVKIINGRSVVSDFSDGPNADAVPFRGKATTGRDPGDRCRSEWLDVAENVAYFFTKERKASRAQEFPMAKEWMELLGKCDELVG
ncbi:hypothetical protein BO78DRAFT_427446 [Aspergillus sclerotiicarbonarius CBS 121057]|uniref:Protein kinase domain-containing protein n=1 Tax=Aspergillus sclerotiicarbonarius (strain CBS 121057 / IBT 28362) TaxID=1448318 RepID=A0A319EIN9_ASPSB|nr:hypothetical protein BO78DRAFT_427446 [Aspergillus sclerotiicarbonarius CBS 121057]